MCGVWECYEWQVYAKGTSVLTFGFVIVARRDEDQREKREKKMGIKKTRFPK